QLAHRGLPDWVSFNNLHSDRSGGLVQTFLSFASTNTNFQDNPKGFCPSVDLPDVIHGANQRRESEFFDRLLVQRSQSPPNHFPVFDICVCQRSFSKVIPSHSY